MSKPIAILTADIHLRDTQPICRTDNYWEAQSKKLSFIKILQNDLNLPIIDAGDIFHKAKSSPFLEGFAMKNFPNNVFTIPGNHDLPNHKLDDIFNSSLNVLSVHKEDLKVLLDNTYSFLQNVPNRKNKNVDRKQITLVPFPYGKEIKDYGLSKEKFDIHMAIIHTLVLSPDEDEWFGGKGDYARAILKKFPCYDLILTGHNHKSFVVEHEGRLLVNPGSMMRYAANQINHKPCIYLWFDDNHIEEIFIPIEKDVISRAHLETQKKKDERIASFVEQVKTDYKMEFSFENNMDLFFLNNEVDKPVKEIINESMV